VYWFTIETSKGTTEASLTTLPKLLNLPSDIHQVAVKVLNINPRRAVEKYEKVGRLTIVC
jgi:hypothetical protein